jgi:hypothetical protein
MRAGLRVTSLLLAVIGVAGGARAEERDVQRDLEAAEQALVNLDYDGANKAAASLADERGLTHDQLVRVYRVLALTDAVLDKEPAARDAFQRLLTYDPSFSADPNLGPKVETPFLEARGFIRAQATQPGLDVSVSVRAGEGGAIRVTTRDPLHLAKRAAVGIRWSADAAFTIEPVAVAEGASVPIPPPPVGVGRFDYYVAVLDDREDVILESGNPAAPKTAMIEIPAPPPPPPAEHRSLLESPVFWVIAGAVVAGVGTGAYFAARGSSGTSPPTGVSLSLSAQCGYSPASSSSCR